ncbi:MAG: nucleotidyl transferase AbiEii/AbiGii toxin family protein [Sulfurospirillaceae bacterium]|nr:nucleotidyl transferase AbiEii/AbiGii toxin family protein [Sulfurospirillaceae bacterium]
MDTKTHQFILATYAKQIKALNDLVGECKRLLPNNDLSFLRFGGGTALAIYHFQHRKSFDIDLFVTDPQLLNYLSPKHWIEDSNTFNTAKYIDLANHIRLLTRENIKIDILVSQDFISQPIIDSSQAFFHETIYVESLEDILAKKIVYRKDQNKARDIIDLSVALYHDEFIFEKLLQYEAVLLQDLHDLHDALQRLNYQRYLDEIDLVEPIESYLEVAKNAPNSIMKALKKYL